MKLLDLVGRISHCSAVKQAGEIPPLPGANLIPSLSAPFTTPLDAAQPGGIESLLGSPGVPVITDLSEGIQA